MATYPELNLLGLNIDSFSWGAEKIRASFGGGRVMSALVGSSAGLHRWVLSAGVLPSDTGFGTISSKSRFNYYFDFYKTRTTGSNEHFAITFQGKKYTVAFVRTDFDFEVFSSDLYAGGVEIEQRMIAGESYDTDGSFLGLVS